MSKHVGHADMHLWKVEYVGLEIRFGRPSTKCPQTASPGINGQKTVQMSCKAQQQLSGFVKNFFPIITMEEGGWVQVSLWIFFGKSSQNIPKLVLIFWSSIPCVFCLYYHIAVRLVCVESTLLKLRVRTSRQLIWLACMETLLDDVPRKIVWYCYPVRRHCRWATCGECMYFSWKWRCIIGPTGSSMNKYIYIARSCWLFWFEYSVHAVTC